MIPIAAYADRLSVRPGETIRFHAANATGASLDMSLVRVRSADALSDLLAKKGLQLDAVVEVKVDDAALLARIEKRAAETGGARADDNAETLKKRLDVYHAQTAPLIDYYADRGMLKSVDGMQPIDAVSEEIGRVLSA